MENVQHITLDVNGLRNNDYIYTKQYDVGRDIIFSITDNGKYIDLSNLTVLFSLKKPDGYIISDATTVPTSSTTVKVTLTDQMTVLSGVLPYQLSLLDINGVCISTVTGYMNCEKAVVQQDDFESVSDGSYLTEVSTANEAAMRATIAANQSEYYSDEAHKVADILSTLEANPSDEATESLEKISIDGVVYEIENETSLPDISTEDDGKVLAVVNGEWKLIDIAIGGEGSNIAYHVSEDTNLGEFLAEHSYFD